MPTASLPTLRLARQRISHAPFARPEEVVRWMGAMQAQEYAQALWAVGARVRAATQEAVEQSIAEGKIVRTWPMRGTLHFVAPEDAAWITRLNAARVLASARSRHNQLKLDDAIFARSQQLFYDALSGGRRLTRPEMLTLLEQAGISTESQRGYHILWQAALSGLICMGPMQGKQQTFVLLEEWAPNPASFPREIALAELARRYLTSHGPATPRDFAWWGALTLTDARAGFVSAGEGITQMEVEGVDYWLPAEALDAPGQPARRVHLLPGYDEYLLGYTDRSAVLAGQHAPQIDPGGNGVFRPMLLVDGQVAGTWNKTIKKQAMEIVLKPFGSLVLPGKLLDEACLPYASFLGIAQPAIRVSNDL